MATEPKKSLSMPRRQFLKTSLASVAAAGVGNISTDSEAAADEKPAESKRGRAPKSILAHTYQGSYAGEHLNRVAFPMGGLGAGMICLEGRGALSHVSLRHRPEIFHEPLLFSALYIESKQKMARVLEGPVPSWKIFGAPGTGNGAGGTSYGFPRFSAARFKTRFPFGSIELLDGKAPVRVTIKGWSPFEPGDADHSSLPVAALEYRVTNATRAPVKCVYSFNARNFLAASGQGQAVRSIPEGFVLWGAGAKDKPWEECALSATVSDPHLKVNHAWFRGGWFDALTMAWKDIEEGASYDRPPITSGAPAPGATLFVPFELGPGASKTIVLRLAWFTGQSNLRIGKDPQDAGPADQGPYRPWYASRFENIEKVTGFWKDQYEALKTQSQRFSDCFHDSSLPAEVIEAVAANLTILKSPTVLRQFDGKLWAWEGCGDNSGCCHGTCTHVWNYAQAIPHLFPALERTLRETEFGPSQNEAGHQTFRSALPIRPVDHDFHAAADGQLGGIMKAHREWRISGDTEWLRRLWPKIKSSLNYCINTWDPEGQGWLEEPHHNTYDIEFWGPDGMCTSFYLGALQAATAMGRALREDVSLYEQLLEKGLQRTEAELYDGEYYIQKIQWQGLRARNPLEMKSMVGDYSPEAQALLQKEGPKYQYGKGCLSDGVLGSWLALVCGAGQVLNPGRVASHLRAVHRYNLKLDLSEHANPQRPAYACGNEGGLLLCSWPKGGALSLPFVYSNEVWTGIEYQVAAHLMMMGETAKGLEIVRVCRDRYDGRVRNPFNEYECGHWYARAMSSYALLQGLTGIRYDAVEKILYMEPRIPGDFRSFFAAAAGYGTAGVNRGKPFFKPVQGDLEIREIRYEPCRPAAKS